MGRVKGEAHPDGRKRGRNHQFFPQLIGFSHAIQRVIAESPDTSGQQRTMAQVHEHVTTQAKKRQDKLARRAARAKTNPQKE